MKALALFLAIFSACAVATANAQINTGKTLVSNLAAFNPVPGGAFTPDQMRTISELARKLWAQNHMMKSFDAVTIKDVKAWPRSTGDGVIVCATFPPSGPDGIRVEETAAISITMTGPFKDYVIQNLYDSQAYNLVGCNTPGASTN